jgi:hypothetical protein
MMSFKILKYMNSLDFYRSIRLSTDSAFADGTTFSGSTRLKYIGTPKNAGKKIMVAPTSGVFQHTGTYGSNSSCRLLAKVARTYKKGILASAQRWYRTVCCLEKKKQSEKHTDCWC